MFVPLWSNDELVDITTTDWFKKIDSEMKPKDYLKTYRKIFNLTQSQLSGQIGVSVQLPVRYGDREKNYQPEKGERIGGNLWV